MAEQTLWTSYTPVSTNANDSTNYSLGTTFYADAPGWVLGVKWRFPDTVPTGTVSAKLWRVIGDDQLVASGNQLAVANFVSPVAGAVNEVRFSSAVAILANTVYVVSIWTADRYVATVGYAPYGSGGGGVNSGNLHSPEPGTDPLGVGTLHNAKLNPNASHNFPHQSFGNSTYWVDVIFTTDDPNAATPKSTSDSATATDTVTLATAQSINQAVSATDAVTLAATLSGPDTVTATDTVSLAASVPVAETVSFADSVSVARFATISETINFNDQLTTMAFFTITDGFTTTEGFGPIGLIIADNISVVEAIAANANLSVSEVISVLDSVVRQIEGQDDNITSPVTLVRRTPHITIKKLPPEITIRRM